MGCLRGISVALGLPHSFLRAMRPVAKAALAADAPRAPAAVLARAPAATSRVDRALRRLVEAGAARGVAVCAFVGGRVAVDAVAGSLSPADRRPVRSDTLFAVWSGGKGVTAALARCLVADGTLDLDAPVAKYRGGVAISRGGSRPRRGAPRGYSEGRSRFAAPPRNAA